MELNIQIEKLFKLAFEHQLVHGCSAHPYEHGKRLAEAIQKTKPSRILEIGTGIGYTASIMALAGPDTHIDTIEKDLEHANLSRQFIQGVNVSSQINIIIESAEKYLPTLQEKYDFIFFDGYQIHFEFLPQYEKLLKSGGTLFLANNHLKSKTSDQFFSELQNPMVWEMIEKFADTSVVLKV